MPPPWSLRALSNGPSNSQPSAAEQYPERPSEGSSRDRPLPRRPQGERSDVTTLSIPPDRRQSPTRSQTLAPRTASHSRSASNPLPKLFSRKKSTGNLKNGSADPSFDDEMVSGVDNNARNATGKKGKLEEDGTTARRCMCCDSKLKVPKDVNKFRCMCCLTINDVVPLEDQTNEDEDRTITASGHTRSPQKMPLSLGRTRALIDQCLVTYLENRYRQYSEAAVVPSNTLTDVRTAAFSDNEAGLQLQPSLSTLGRPHHSAISSTPPATPVFEQPQYGHAAPQPSVARPTTASGRRPSTPPHEAPAPANMGASPRVQRKPVPAHPHRKPPPPPVEIPVRQAPSRQFSSASLTPTNLSYMPRPAPSPRLFREDSARRSRYERSKGIFRPLEDYLIANYGDYRCVNASFSTVRPSASIRTRSESNIPQTQTSSHRNERPQTGRADANADLFSELDAKTLLLGDIGENGSWWTGRTDGNQDDKAFRRKKVAEPTPRKAVSSRSPNIDWRELAAWYGLLHHAGADWRSKLGQMVSSEAGDSERPSLDSSDNSNEIEEDLADAREHVVRTLLKLTENLLKRPTRILKAPEETRFLMILLANPSLYPQRPMISRSKSVPTDRSMGALPSQKSIPDSGLQRHESSPQKSTSKTAMHSGILKRILGLMAHSSEHCHRYLIGWFAYLEEAHFVRIVDLVASFVSQRISRKSGHSRKKSGIDDGGLIPDLSGSALSTSAQLHSAMGLSGAVKSRADDANSEPSWADDWQTRAAAMVMALLFKANDIWFDQPRHAVPQRPDSSIAGSDLLARARMPKSGQLLPTSSFYNSLLDYHDMIADFRVWEAKRDKFAFCQYPFFLAMGTKIKILEHDARRQMESKAREAYFDQVIRQRVMDSHFQLRVRRECIIDDSLRQISEAVGTGQEELKKGLRVQFTGEEGVDAGGLRKEWFLVLVRDIFDPNHGMFVYDDDSRACYFNPHSFETSDQYYLVGALLGLAIYNSTILDVALPSFAFRKLLASAPPGGTGASNLATSAGSKSHMHYSIADLAEFRPKLATGLQGLLDFEGDVESTYCWDFVVPIERYGAVTDVPLKPGGEGIPVTNSNRQEFVDAYVRYLLDTAVSRQFEPFKRGFFTVCAGNALSLFRGEEIELLVRGSDEPLNVASLRAVALYDNWKQPLPPHTIIEKPAESVPVVRWFWDIFSEAASEKQRKLLIFITGSDRIPAVGATSLVLRIVAGGDGHGQGNAEERQRFPIARTCFNMLVLWHYAHREELEEKLWRAVYESEGFGLK